MGKKIAVNLVLNGEERVELVDAGTTLLSALRDRFGDTSPKGGCHQGTCGACSVLVNGALKLSCLMLAERCDYAEVVTAAGLSGDGSLHPIQTAFLDGFASQCGFCTPGMIIAAKALLDDNPNPTRDEVIEALSGNICRCTGYEPIIDAVLAAARADTGRVA